MSTTFQDYSALARSQGASGASVLLLALAVFAFLYFFFEVFVVVFGAVLVAVVLTLLARPLRKWLKLHHWAALGLVCLLVLGLLGATGYLFGTRLAFDIQNVASRMEAAQNTIRTQLQQSALGQMALLRLGGDGIPVTQIITSVFSISANVMAGAVVAVIAGVYFAAQPSLYLNGFLTLFPKERRANARETVVDIGGALCLWLQGQAISMLLIGILATLAAWVVGLPSPLALGLIAGLTQFIPYVGPILSAVPAVLVAATQGLDFVVWTLAAYLAIHTLEGNFVEPLIQQRMVYVPPAVMVLGIAAIGFIFGTVAVIFAAPMTVVLFVLIKKLYVRDALHEETDIPGEAHS
jgi:predicted PurR-regulated permease PerM